MNFTDTWFEISWNSCRLQEAKTFSMKLGQFKGVKEKHLGIKKEK